MTLARSNLLRSLVLALGAAGLLFAVVEWLRARDRAVALERVVASYQTELARQSCESDPQWFLAGPRVGRPSAEARLQPDADVRLPRPSSDPLPLEVFAYDDQFAAASVAAPRFPDEFKRLMRAAQPVRLVSGSYSGKTGTGLQMARLTGWTPGPCAVLLFRMQPVPHHLAKRALLFGGLFATCFAVAFLAVSPATTRIRKLAVAARASARQDYSGMTPVKGTDEISALGAIFNETAADIRRRIVDAQDREEALQRYVANTNEGVAVPLGALEKRLGDLDRAGRLPPEAEREVRLALREAHGLTTRLQNLAAVAELRAVTEASPRESIDLRALVERVVSIRAPLAHAAGVAVDLAAPDGRATIAADTALMEQAVGNILDNAILYNRAGGQVRVELRGYERDGRFSLRVVDNGPGVSDEEFAGLTANRRFRGDEAKTRRPGGRGLGLALTREVADRFGLQLDLRRPTSGGFEVELSTRR